MSSDIQKYLLPKVKECQTSDRPVTYAGGLRLEPACEIEPLVLKHIRAVFSADLQAAGLEESGGGPPVRLEKADTALTPSETEGYQLELKKDAITVRANADAGLLYGILTLGQILGLGPDLTELTLTDWPTLALRGYHIDLKTLPLSVDYTQRLIDELAACKINAVLIEYEDKFPYRNNSEFVAESAFTLGQINALNAYCKARCVEIIPLVQSYGHLEYILKHEQFAHMREDQRAVNELCGTNPANKRFITDMMQEVIAAHPGLQYFHIGGDEPFRVAFCENCRKIVDTQGKGALYLQHIKPILEFVQAQGITPIMWDDMVATHPEISDKLPKPVVLNYWLYQPSTESSPAILQRGQGRLSIAELKERMPKEEVEKFEPYWKCEKYPAEGLNFHMVKYYKDFGYPVLGGSAARTSGSSPLATKTISENTRIFSKRITEHNELGVVATAWAASNSLAQPTEHWEYYMCGNLAQAEHGWNGGATQLKDYIDRFLFRYYGLRDARVSAFYTADVEEKGRLLADYIEYAAHLAPARHRGNFELLTNRFRRAGIKKTLDTLLLEEMRHTLRHDESMFLKLDLSAHANRGLYDEGEVLGWSNQGENDMREFPTGHQIFGGVPFAIIDPAQNENRAVVTLKNYLQDQDLPTVVEDIAVNAKCQSLFFLHTFANGFTQDLERLGHYTLHYEDGTIYEVPIIQDLSVQGWWKVKYASNAIPVWRGYNAVTRRNGVPIGVYLYAKENFSPNKQIVSISMHTNERANLILLGITALKMDARPHAHPPEWQALQEKMRGLGDALDAGWAQEKQHLERYLDKKTIRAFKEVFYDKLRDTIQTAALCLPPFIQGRSANP